MDGTDLKIIELLKSNSRMSSSEISRIIHLSAPAVAERIRKLEEAKIISQYTLRIQREKFDLNLMAFILVCLGGRSSTEVFKSTMQANENVLECHHIAGEYDYLLKVAVNSTAGLESFITNTLKHAAGVEKSNTLVVLSTVKENF